MENSSKFITNHSYAGTSIRCCIESLRNEKLFVDNEKENIQSLFNSVTNISKDLVISGWLLGKQWSIFETLIEDKQCAQFDHYFQRFGIYFCFDNFGYFNFIICIYKHCNFDV